MHITFDTMSGQLRKTDARKRESGVQLLARLISRVDLSSIDPDVFSKAPSSSSSASANKIIEVYGAEGVGKTEMILHYIAKACLPSNWNGLSIQGLGAKVIFIDTEFKFSVFRLAIVLENQILAILEKLKLNFKDTDPAISKDAALSTSGAVSVVTEEYFDVDKCKTFNKIVLEGGDASDVCTGKPLKCDSGEHSGSVTKECMDISNKCDEPYASSASISGCGRGKESDNSHSGKSMLLTPIEIEDLVQDALGRVQVLHAASTDQLLISLLALEHTLSHDPLLSLIVIDTISAFYWIDKLGDLDNPGCTQSKMSPVANIVSKYVSDFGVTFLVTKSALIGSQRGRISQGNYSKSVCMSVSTDDQNWHRAIDRSEQILQEHVEFLGKSWSQLDKKRLVLTKSVDRTGKLMRAVMCVDWMQCKGFSCTDDGLKFL